MTIVTVTQVLPVIVTRSFALGSGYARLILPFSSIKINQTLCLFVKKRPKQYQVDMYSEQYYFLTCAHCCDTLNILSTQEHKLIIAYYEHHKCTVALLVAPCNDKHVT